MIESAVADVLPHLPVLVALGEVEHVTAAAAIVGMPQPTVSRIIRRMEARLGVTLVEPAGRGIRLTDAAKAFIPYAQRSLDALVDGLRVLDERDQVQRATVRIAFQTSLGERFVPAMIRATRTRAPGLRFVLSQGARQMCLDMLLADQTDIALVSRLIPPPEALEVLHLFEQPLCVLVAADHRWSDATSLRINDLAGEPIVTLKTGFGLRSSVDELLAAAGVLPVLAFEGDDLHTMRGLVAAGLGVAIAPQESPEPAGCRQITISGQVARRDMGAAVRKNHTTSAAVQTVLDTLADMH